MCTAVGASSAGDFCAEGQVSDPPARYAVFPAESSLFCGAGDIGLLYHGRGPPALAARCRDCELCCLARIGDPDPRRIQSCFGLILPKVVRLYLVGLQEPVQNIKVSSASIHRGKLTE